MTLIDTHETPDQFYVPSDIKQKRFRRTKADITGIRKAIINILTEDNPQTVRQVFYALTVRGVAFSFVLMAVAAAVTHCPLCACR
jgi:hypothetical protein